MKTLKEKLEKELKNFANYIYGLSPHNFEFKIEKDNKDIKYFVELKIIPLIKKQDKEFIEELKDELTMDNNFSEDISDDICLKLNIKICDTINKLTGYLK